MRFTRFSMAALNSETDAVTMFCVTTWGEKTESPS